MQHSTGRADRNLARLESLDVAFDLIASNERATADRTRELATDRVDHVGYLQRYLACRCQYQHLKRVAFALQDMLERNHSEH